MRISKSLPTTEAETAAILERELPRLLEGFTIRKAVRTPRKDGPDMLVEIKAGPIRRNLLVEIKQIGEPRIAIQAIPKLRMYMNTFKNGYPVLAAPYLTETTRQILKDSGVGYFDLVGNAFLRFDNVFIERSTPEALRLERRALQSLAPPKTSRVIKRLLSEPQREFRVTELAKLSQVSAPQAYKVAKLLEAKGLAVRDKDRRIKVTDPAKLLEAWANSQDFKKNRLVLAYSLERTPQDIMKRIAKSSSESGRPYAFTMFAGASLIAPFARFYEVTFYVRGELDAWLNDLDLKPVEAGSNVQLAIPRDEFVLENIQDVNGLRVVSNVQLFADLYNNPGRGREQAEFLRERKIEF